MFLLFFFVYFLSVFHLLESLLLRCLSVYREFELTVGRLILVINDKAREEILPSLERLRATIVGDDARQKQLFGIYLVDWFLHRVYDELAGPLTDAITPAPER